MNSKKINKVAIIMGSQSDYSTMKYSKKVLQSFSIKSDVKIVSAHRTPKRMFEFAKNAEKNNYSVIIAGAGGSAHLPGMVASLTNIPVIGVPIEIITYLLFLQALKSFDAIILLFFKFLFKVFFACSSLKGIFPELIKLLFFSFKSIKLIFIPVSANANPKGNPT